MFRAYIVDDERRAIEVIEDMLRLFANDFTVVGSSQHIESAKEFLLEQEVDLVFLDISIGQRTGFDLLLSLGANRDFEIIFTTAHKEWTLKAMRQGATDYLMKPIDPDEFTQALERFRKKRTVEKGSVQNDDQLALSGVSDVRFVTISDIAIVKADGNYCEVRTIHGESIIASKQLNVFEQKLKKHGFLRVHRSYLVNMHQVVGVQKSSGGSLLVQGSPDAVPIGASNKEDVMEYLAAHSTFL